MSSSDSDSGPSPTVVDLFCGAGGLSAGLSEAGFDPVMGIDFDEHALASFAMNHPDAVAVCDDIQNVRVDDVFEAAGSDEIDLLAGGPSCQGYSTHGKRIEDDPRNFLFREFLRLATGVRPKFVLLENVKGLLTYRAGYFRKLIEDSFERIGYRITSRVLLAADYGVPQLRERIFFIGTRLDGVPLSFPRPTHRPADDLQFRRLKPHVTVGEAISDLPLLGDNLNEGRWEYASKPKSQFQRYARARTRARYVTLHKANGVSDAAREVIELVAEGEGLRSIATDLLPARFKRMRRIKNGSLRKDCTTLYYRLSRRAPAYTITCYFRNVASGPFTHPCEDRSLSFREAARLMSFRDSYKFRDKTLARQIGNAVPPLLAKAMGRQIRSLLQQAEAGNRRIAVAV